MLLSIAGDDSGVDAYVRAARQHNLEGVIMMAVDEHHPSITALVAADVPCVALDLPIQGPRATHVTSDNRAGAATAVRHLHSLGHRRIATVTGPLNLMPAAERLAGYRYGLATVGLPYRPEYAATGDFFLSSGYEGMRRLLALDEPPSAVFAAGDEMAIGAMHAVEDAGLRVPDDVALVGFDDIEPAALVRPALTTVAQDKLAFGAAAMSALLHTIGSDPDQGLVPAPRIVPTQLVVRMSCGSRL
jgi:LacI family transcriptional regulator